MNMREKITGDIARVGFSTIGVGDPNGNFAYTVGFTELGHPEILVCGLRLDNCHGLMWEIFHKVKAGEKFVAGQVATDIGNLPVAFRYLPDIAANDFCCQALFHYEGSAKTPTFLQMVIPDNNGLLPWQEGYDHEFMRAQRHLWVDLN
jgi:hypothetical protein